MWSNFCFKMKILFDGKLAVLFFVYFRNFKVAIFLALAQCSLFFTISWIWKILDQYLNSRKIQVCLISGEDDSFLSVALNSSKSIILINTLSYCLYLLFMTINFSPPISFYEYLLKFWENKVFVEQNFSLHSSDQFIVGCWKLCPSKILPERNFYLTKIWLLRYANDIKQILVNVINLRGGSEKEIIKLKRFKDENSHLKMLAHRDNYLI